MSLPQFRPATSSDIPAIMKIMADAVALMKSEGRTQWDDTYPALSDIAKDIDSHIGYVVCVGGVPAAYAAITFEREAAYEVIDGRWLSGDEAAYVVVHRVAVGAAYRGQRMGLRLLKEAANMALARGVNNLRVDTNFDNAQMLRMLKGEGFAECGKVEMARGQRIAFEKILG